MSDAHTTRTDIQKVKDKLTKLLKLSENDAASDGEIQAALNLATQLMTKHQITREDVDLENETDPTSRIKFDRVSVFTLSAKLFRWESELAHFVCSFIGSVKHYSEADPVTVRRNGFVELDTNNKPKRAKKILFYGPEEDSEAAAELYSELQTAIQAMGIMRFGGWAKGDGGAYCEGFVRGLDSAHRSAIKNLELSNEQTSALMVVSNERQLAIHNGAKNWLSTECNVELVTSQGTRGASSGSHSARREGIMDGKKYNPNRPAGVKKIQ